MPAKSELLLYSLELFFWDVDTRLIDGGTKSLKASRQQEAVVVARVGTALVRVVEQARRRAPPLGGVRSLRRCA